MENTNKLATAKDNLLKKVIKENKIPEISSLNLLRWTSLKSAWIEGGIIKSAPRQKPVIHEIIIKKCISPLDRNKTNIKKNADRIKEVTQVLFLPNLLLKYVQKGTPRIANKK